MVRAKAKAAKPPAKTLAKTVAKVVRPPAKATTNGTKLQASKLASKTPQRNGAKVAASTSAALNDKSRRPSNPAKSLPPAVKASSNAKSRQLATSAKSGIEMKTQPASVPPSVPIAPAKPKGAQPSIVMPADYQPSDAEPFMNSLQRHYFRLKLLSWKEDILRQTRETLQGMLDETVQYADLADRATSETDRALELRARDRQRKLIAKIDAALARIEDGTYGYCEETGEPIGLKRLDARPIATLSLEAQERHERRERVHRGD